VTSHEAVLFEESYQVEGGAFDRAGQASTRLKALLTRMKIPKDAVRRTAIVTYEAEMNICSYADRGTIAVRVTEDDITIEAVDEGPGIADIRLAMKEGYSTATEKIWRMGFGAGMGLRNMKCYSDDFSISSEVGKGTRVKMVIHRPKPAATAS
jgi:anti-sigma regulatory factor (Ser/Thr protein kinase)